MRDIDLSPIRERLRWRVVDPTLTIPGTSLTLAALKAKAQAAADDTGSPGHATSFFQAPIRPYRGLVYAILAAVFFFFALVLQFAPAMAIPRAYSGIVVVLLLAVGSIAGVRSWACFRPEAEFVVTADGRPPVVYLRSFRDEAAHVAIGERPFAFWSGITMLSWKYIKSLRTSPIQHGVRLEQVVARFTGRLGPFVTIGEPGETYPNFGATRAYFSRSDQKWKNKVIEWITRSSMVVLVPGTTPGLAWELGQALHPDSAGKLVMVFPADRAWARKARLAAASHTCPDGPWKKALQAPARGELVALFASDDGEVVRVTCAKPEIIEFEIALHLAIVEILSASDLFQTPSHQRQTIVQLRNQRH